MNGAFLLPLGTLLAALSAEGAWGVAYSPVDVTTPRAPIVFLHGMWAGPEESCRDFVPAATPFGFLVCPRGNTPHGSGTMWTGTYADAERSIRRAIAAAARALPGHLEKERGGTLIGYSNGAYFAAEVAYAEPGRWPGLILLSMKVDLDPVRLRAARVERVVLAAATRDPVRDAMRTAADRLSASGFSAQFINLGPGGHELPSDIGARMCRAIAWVRSESDGSCGTAPDSNQNTSH